ncbi:hypothetical protein CYLTODRAFT_476711 [Cylindrobasidium torrendii FP15055 ss-10]|uniref:Uncharacterized protein n=1 Tax=Cylindrobasidium torrendii FP15055 ss-10 TaxID=1314674 RepID=A0A0D7BI00_9AGAR|nr:hypothetical protein CYLTODRAFT_476711 [Cylindrobasidium torrendii FP15055 ss-10]
MATLPLSPTHRDASDKENPASTCDTTTKNLHSPRLSVTTALSAVNQIRLTDDDIHFEVLISNDDKRIARAQGVPQDVDPRRVVDNNGEAASNGLGIVRTETKYLKIGKSPFPNNNKALEENYETTASVELCAGDKDLDGDNETPAEHATSLSCQNSLLHTPKDGTALVTSFNLTKRNHSTAFGSTLIDVRSQKRAAPTLPEPFPQPKHSKPSIEWPFIPTDVYYWHSLDPTRGVAIDECIIRETTDTFAAAYPAYELGGHLSYYTLPDDKFRILVHAYDGDEVKTTFKNDRSDPTIGVDMCRLLKAHPYLTIRAVEQGQFHYAYHKRKFCGTTRYVCPHCKEPFSSRDSKGTKHFVECRKLAEMEKIVQKVNESWFIIPGYRYREAWFPAVV